MKRIEFIAAAHPRVGTMLSPNAADVRGQLAAIGFTPSDGVTGVDWVITDDTADMAGTDVPVLHLDGKISIYGLKQAVIALFDSQGA